MMRDFVGKVGTLTPLIGEDNLPVYSKCLWYRIPLFEYQDAVPPVTFTDDDGIAYQMDHHFNTDGGSIPFIVRVCPGVHLDPFNFPRAYLFHDCAYQFGGLYIKYPSEKEFLFRLMTKQDVDKLLLKLLPFDGATKADVDVIAFGLWVGGNGHWSPSEQEQARKNRKTIVVVHNRSGNVVTE